MDPQLRVRNEMMYVDASTKVAIVAHAAKNYLQFVVMTCLMTRR